MKIELAGLPVILFTVFLILKLCKVIGWSWWWVASPLWIMALFIIAVTVVYYMVALIMISRKYRKK